jgi:hypothetical protein
MTAFASAGAIRSLLQLPTYMVLGLALPPDQWLAVADEIRLGRCLIKRLNLDLFASSSSEATEAVKAVASAIQEDRHLEFLELRMEDGFTDEAGVALAEALTINKTLRVLCLEDNLCDTDPVFTKAYLGVQAFEAFVAMLRVNISLNLDLPEDTFDDDHPGIESLKQISIEQRLNEVGRGRLLASDQTPRAEWVNALQELTATNWYDDAFNVSCLHNLLRLNPSVCMLELNDTTDFGL